VSIAFSPYGSVIATGDGTGTIILWDASTKRQIKRLTRHSEGIHKLVFSPNGQFLASGGYDKQSYLWHVLSGKSVKLNTNLYYVNDVVFHPSGNYLYITSADYTLFCLDLKNNKSYRIKHKTDLTAMAITMKAIFCTSEHMMVRF